MVQIYMKERTIVFIILFTLCGCRTVDLSVYNNSKPVSFNRTSNRQDVFVRHFSRDAKAYFTMFNLITAKNVEFDKIIQEELNANNGDGIINLKIKGQDTFIDQMIPVAVGVFGIIIMPNTPIGVFAAYMIGLRTYTIEGDIVRYIDKEEPPKNSQQNKIDPSTGLPIKKEDKKIEFDPETGLPK